MSQATESTDGPVYEERVTSGRTQALFWGLAILFYLLLTLRMAASGPDAMGAVFLVLATLFLFYSLNFRVLVIRISLEALRLRFGVFRCTIPLGNIETAYRDDDLPALMKYGGAGIHFMVVRKRYRASFNFLEHPRVVVALRRPGVVRDVSFSTRHPDDVIRHLRVAAPRANANGTLNGAGQVRRQGLSNPFHVDPG
jgi:hypothetical protein